MKLKFDKNEAEETVVTVDGNDFVSQSYIELIKELHAGTKIEVEFGTKITEEEQNSINEMLDKINAIDTKADDSEKGGKTADTPDYPEEEINPENMPF